MAYEPHITPPKGWMPDSAGLTMPQLAGIGFVVASWATVETLLQAVLVRLTQSAATLGQALTEDLGPDNRLKALRRLCATWTMVLRPRHPELAESVDAIAALGIWIGQNKDKRNQIAHWNWGRGDDDTLFGFKYHLRPIASLKQPAQMTTYMELKTEELYRFGAEITEKAGELTKRLNEIAKLPPWPDKPA